jgi:Raf kinase inhibitor-like YbhB/YbcL family protein
LIEINASLTMCLHQAGMLTDLENAIRLVSPVFRDGEAIPRRFTCDGEDISPPLQWNGAPAETRSFVLLCDDPDAPAGTWHHWAVYDIPRDHTGLEEGASTRSGAQFEEAVNDFGRSGYGGPCPPRGHSAHHYCFRLLALSVDHLPLGKGVHCREVAIEASEHVLAKALLVGLYER